jgi:hypothetical protein
VVIELTSVDVLEVNDAPEPTAIAPAARRLARGMRTLRRLLVELLMVNLLVFGSL